MSLLTLYPSYYQAKRFPSDLARQRLILNYSRQLKSSMMLVHGTRRQIRINTAQLYKQQRFNLWREESEGYARLLVTLNQASSWEQP